MNTLNGTESDASTFGLVFDGSEQVTSSSARGIDFEQTETQANQDLEALSKQRLKRIRINIDIDKTCHWRMKKYFAVRTHIYYMLIK